MNDQNTFPGFFDSPCCGYAHNGTELTVFEFGRQIHANSTRFGLQSSFSVDNSLVTMYAKYGCIEEANRVLDLRCVRNMISLC
ncbi:hypothetical protein PanWU01x14_206210 [Parasponia andersonii]|uniref:Uncharacterized protein n=1 Tax=Parasponia andersonii TaxID=3476 RepID=A0A2P5BVX8_PARAD|nr:hypothetical protein PanWU01x14_206210 [Parasponia andersonii]